MNYRFSAPTKTISLCQQPTLLLSCVVALLSAAPARAQSDNFNAGDDQAWTHYDMATIGTMLGMQLPGAAYTFPPDGSGGYGYRIDAPPSPSSDLGPGRALSTRQDVSYAGRFSLGVDVLAWNNTTDEAFGPAWFVGNIGPGSTTGYTMTYDPDVPRLQVSVVANEEGSALAGYDNCYLDPTARYRFIASSHDGSTFLAQVFYIDDLVNPVASVLTADPASSYNSGYCGLLAYDGGGGNGADATFDNYVAATPAAKALPATVVSLSPRPRSTTTAVYPVVQAGIVNRDTGVNPNSIMLWMDAAAVPSSALTVTPAVGNGFSGATLVYPLSTLLPVGSTHTNQIAYQDDSGKWQTNAWSWTIAYPLLRATNSLPVGSLSARGWKVRMAMTNGPVLANSLARAEEQLATPPLIPFIATTQTVLNVLNFNDTGDGTSAVDFGGFTGATPIPGLPPDGTHNNVACEMLAYLELTAGMHRFGVESDDGFQLRSGASLWDTKATVLGFIDGATFKGTFDFVVEATGLYPVRCVWYQTGGTACFQLYSVDLNDPTSMILINDPANPTGVVQAFVPNVDALTPQLLASDSAGGPYKPVTGAVVDTDKHVVTVPFSGSAQQFYKMSMSKPLTMTAISIVGTNVVIGYR